MAPAARQRILDSAARLFYAYGVRAVGVDRVIAESGVAKATLYKHFPAKDDLILAYLDRVDDVWRGQLAAAAMAVGDDPRDQLIGAFDALASATRRDGYRGCAFINTAGACDPGGRVHDRTVAHKDAVRQWLADLAARAGAADPGGLARTLSIILDGGLAAGALDGDPAVAASAKSAAAAVVDAALAGAAAVGDAALASRP